MGERDWHAKGNVPNEYPLRPPPAAAGPELPVRTPLCLAV